MLEIVKLDSGQGALLEVRAASALDAAGINQLLAHDRASHRAASSPASGLRKAAPTEKGRATTIPIRGRRRPGAPQSLRRAVGRVGKLGEG